MNRSILYVFLTIGFIFHSAYLQGQAPSGKILKMPVDEETKLVTYKAVVDLANVPASELQQRAFIWASGYYKNPSDVIRERDTVGHKMTCKARLRISNEADKKGVVTEAGLIEYTLRLEFKDNKYRYILSEINWKQKSYYPVERWMDPAAAGYQPSYPYYLQQTDDLMKQLVNDLDKGMKLPSVKVRKDDW